MFEIDVQIIRFVHRDVAARNVLVHAADDSQEKLLCKITDFGLSR